MFWNSRAYFSFNVREIWWSCFWKNPNIFLWWGTISCGSCLGVTSRGGGAGEAGEGWVCNTPFLGKAVSHGVFLSNSLNVLNIFCRFVGFTYSTLAVFPSVYVTGHQINSKILHTKNKAKSAPDRCKKCACNWSKKFPGFKFPNHLYKDRLNELFCKILGPQGNTWTLVFHLMGGIG